MRDDYDVCPWCDRVIYLPGFDSHVRECRFYAYIPDTLPPIKWVSSCPETGTGAAANTTPEAKP